MPKIEIVILKYNPHKPLELIFIFVGYFTARSVARLHWSIGTGVNEWWFGKDLKGTDYDWIDIISWDLYAGDEENHEKTLDRQ
jgi:hypothetical protein